MISAPAHLVRLGRAGYVFAREGVFGIVDPSDVPGLDRLYDFYSFNIIPALGRAVAGDAESYRYLVESIRRFPKPEAFAAMLRAAGFRRVTFQQLTGGIVALHCGWRL